MYIRCPKCSNMTFKITADRKAECTSCGNIIELCAEKTPKPVPPEPLPPVKPEKYWFE